VRPKLKKRQREIGFENCLPSARPDNRRKKMGTQSCRKRQGARWWKGRKNKADNIKAKGKVLRKKAKAIQK
jgi:hypothetical protein